MTHAEEIMRAVATIVNQDDRAVFTRKQIREQIGIDQDTWMSGYTAIFQGMRADQPGAAPTVDHRLKGVFRQVERGKHMLTDRGKRVLKEFKT